MLGTLSTKKEVSLISMRNSQICRTPLLLIRAQPRVHGRKIATSYDIKIWIMSWIIIPQNILFTQGQPKPEIWNAKNTV